MPPDHVAGFRARPRFPQPIDLLDRPIHRLGGTRFVLFGQAEGDVGPCAGAYPRTAERRGDATSARRIDSGETTAELQDVGTGSKPVSTHHHAG